MTKIAVGIFQDPQLSIWKHLEAIGSNWKHLEANGSKWKQTEANGGNWKQMEANGSKWKQTTPFLGGLILSTLPLWDKINKTIH